MPFDQASIVKAPHRWVTLWVDELHIKCKNTKNVNIGLLYDYCEQIWREHE